MQFDAALFYGGAAWELWLHEKYKISPSRLFYPFAAKRIDLAGTALAGFMPIDAGMQAWKAGMWNQDFWMQYARGL